MGFVVGFYVVLNYENEQYMEVRKNIPDVGKRLK